MNEITLEQKIEGLLFYKGENVKIKKLAELLNVEIEEIEKSLLILENNLQNRGLVLVRHEDEVVLGIVKELGPTIESIRKDEITKELTRSALETLSIVMYKNGVARSEIDYIRGVNSGFILRNLVVRGLIERYIDSTDSRKVLYKPSIEALTFMGASSIEDLPNFEKIRQQLEETLQQINND